MDRQRKQMRKLRLALGMTLDALADLSGVSTSMISRILAGRSASQEKVNAVDSTLRAVARVRDSFAQAPIDMSDTKWLRKKISEMGPEPDEEG